MPGLRETGGHTPFVRSQSAHCSVSLHSSPYSSGEPAITGAAALVGLFEQAVTQRRNGSSLSVVVMWRPTPGRALAASELRSRLLEMHNTTNYSH
jgi:hypothetical protein